MEKIFVLHNMLIPEPGEELSTHSDKAAGTWSGMGRNCAEYKIILKFIYKYYIIVS